MRRTTTISAAVERRAYETYAHHRSVSVGDIADSLGVSRTTFFRLRRQWGWPLRAEALERAADRASERTGSGASPGADLRGAASALAQVARRRIAALARAPKRGMDDEKTARALASLARTLTTAQALLEQEGTTRDECERDAAPRRSLNDLRDELARHLERIDAEGEARGGDGLLV